MYDQIKRYFGSCRLFAYASQEALLTELEAKVIARKKRPKSRAGNKISPSIAPTISNFMIRAYQRVHEAVCSESTAAKTSLQPLQPVDKATIRGASAFL